MALMAASTPTELERKAAEVIAAHSAWGRDDSELFGALYETFTARLEELNALLPVSLQERRDD